MIGEYRKEIDGIDSDLVKLFERRMGIASEIGKYKRENGIPIVNREREEAVIERGIAQLGGVSEEIKSEYRRFMTELMAESAALQQKQKAESEGNLYVSCRGGGYGVYIGRGYLARASEFLNLDRKVLIVTDGGEGMRYANVLASQCKLSAVVAIEPGERGKTLQSAERLCHYMISCGMDRHDCVVAVGGGVVGDVTGFAASMYMRGIDFYNLPTTVLSMVDSSIGGKTGVNLHGVKNIVGAFKNPSAVLIDPNTIETLPERQISNGLAEAVKMGLTHDKELFELFERSENPMDNIEYIIKRSLEIKRTAVELDEFEIGVRKALNFGHTLGHGIESVTDLLHGECVSLGMIPMCSEDLKPRLIAVLKKLKLPTDAEFDITSAAQSVIHDKKANGELITCVTVRSPGSYSFVDKDITDLVALLAEVKR